MIIAVCDPKGIAIEAIKTILYAHFLSLASAILTPRHST